MKATAGVPSVLMTGVTRLPPLLSCVLLVMLSPAMAPVASAQSQPMQIVADPLGLFTIGFPSDWRVIKGTRGNVRVVGEAPSRNGFSANVSVQVVALRTPSSPTAFAQQAESYRASWYHGHSVVKEGDAAIAGRPAHFVYMTWKTERSNATLYQVLVYLTAENTGFIVTGATINDPQRIREDFPSITQVIETFHPAG